MEYAELESCVKSRGIQQAINLCLELKNKITTQEKSRNHEKRDELPRETFVGPWVGPWKCSYLRLKDGDPKK